jgi:hypothetical protein
MTADDFRQVAAQSERGRALKAPLALRHWPVEVASPR